MDDPPVQRAAVRYEHEGRRPFYLDTVLHLSSRRVIPADPPQAAVLLVGLPASRLALPWPHLTDATLAATTWHRRQVAPAMAAVAAASSATSANSGAATANRPCTALASEASAPSCDDPSPLTNSSIRTTITAPARKPGEPNRYRTRGGSRRRSGTRSKTRGRTTVPNDSDPNLDRDLARWKQPTELGSWQRLRLDEKDVETLAHLSMKPDASVEDRARELWPSESPKSGIANFQAAVARVNAVASAATGKAGQVVSTPGSDQDGDSPTVRLRLMTGEPRLEAWIED